STYSRLWLPYVLVYLLYTWMRRRPLGAGGALSTVAAGMLALDSIRPAFYAWGFFVREALLCGHGAPYVQQLPADRVTAGFAVVGILLVAAGLFAGRRKE